VQPDISVGQLLDAELIARRVGILDHDAGALSLLQAAEFHRPVAMLILLLLPLVG
jgi:hypothetical protein